MASTVTVFEQPFLALKDQTMEVPAKPAAAIDASGTTFGATWADASDEIVIGGGVGLVETYGTAEIALAGFQAMQQARTKPTTQLTFGVVLNTQGTSLLDAFVVGDNAVEFLLLDDQPADTSAVPLAGTIWGYGVFLGGVRRLFASSNEIATTGDIMIGVNHWELLA